MDGSEKPQFRTVIESEVFQAQCRRIRDDIPLWDEVLFRFKDAVSRRPDLKEPLPGTDVCYWPIDIPQYGIRGGFLIWFRYDDDNVYLEGIQRLV